MSKTKISVLKKILSFIHLWGGLVSGIVVMIVAITGCMFVFEQEIRNFTQKEYRFVEPQNIAKAPLLTLSEVVAKEFPDKKIEQIRVYADASRSTIVKLVDKKAIISTKTKAKNNIQKEEETEKVAYGFNPYTAQLLGRQDLENDFMHYVEEMHTSLFMGEVGKWIIKINVVIFFIMLLTGLYLWWPRKKNQRKMAFNLNLKGKFQVINYSIHNTLGFYFLLPLMLISLTGIWWAIKPVQKGVYAVMGEKMKKPQKLNSTFEEGKIFSPDMAFGSVATQYAGWQEAHINFAKTAKECIRVNLKYPYDVYKKSNVFEFDQYSGKILKSELFVNYSSVDKIKHANRDLHTGQNYGLMGKLLAFFGSLFATSLPVTGFLIWYQRKYKQVVPKTMKTTNVLTLKNNRPRPAFKPQMAKM